MREKERLMEENDKSGIEGDELSNVFFDLFAITTSDPLAQIEYDKLH